MNKLIAYTTLSAALAVSAFAASPFSATVRATYLQTVDHSDSFSALGINFAKNAVGVTDKWIPEIDLNYAFNETWSAQLVLTVPQTHTVKLKGVGSLGDFKQLPPTLLIQYSPVLTHNLRPYVGVGVNYTMIWNDNLSVAGVPLSLENNSIGVAAQAGLNFIIDERLSLNLDIKTAMLRSSVYAGPTYLTEARLDPVLYAVGATYKF